VSRLAALEAGAWVTYAVVVLTLAKVAALFGLLLNAVLSDVALLKTSETLHYVYLAFIIWLTVLEISCRSFSLRGLLCLMLYFLFFII
jgi:hypothetical protein